MPRHSLWAAVAALILAGCAGVTTQPGAGPGPESAPLKERVLSPDERAQFGGVSASAGADGARALYYLALDQAAAGDWAGAGGRWQQVVKRHPGSGWDRPAHYMTAVALERTGDGARAFVQYQQLLTGTAVADLPERAQADCVRLANTLEEPALLQLEKSGYALPQFQPLIRLRLLELGFTAGRVDQVRQGIDDYLKRWPQGPGLDRLEALSTRLEASVPVDPKAIGMLVPKSGPLAPFGEQLRQGAQLAVDLANAGLPEAQRWKLDLADEGSTPAAAQAAAKGLIDQQKVIGLLGPLSSDAAAGLLPLVAARRVPLFSPSAARPDLAEVSPWFFRDTLTPEKQAVAMADELAAARKVTRVAVLAPDTGYGQALAAAFTQRMKQLGAAVPAMVTYAPGTRDFFGPMLQLGGIDPGEAKNADGDEKRDQQSKVEEACTALGSFLLAQAQDLTVPAGVTTTPRLKVLVLDFAQDSPTAQLNAGRAFADRFARTLGQLDELEVQGPTEAERLLAKAGLTVNNLSLSQISSLGQSAGVDYVLGGATAEDLSPSAKLTRRSFGVVAQLLDPRASAVVSQRRFAWTKYKAPPPNPLGLQAIYLPAAAEDVARVLPALQFFDLKVPLMGADQWDRPELGEHLAELEGSIFSDAWWSDSPADGPKRFSAAFRQAYAAKPGLLSAEAFDSAALMLRVLQGGVGDRASLRAALARVSGFDGVTGRTSFEGHQDAVKRPTLVEIRGGAEHLIEER
jgi:ABC-type branched-subunit amino acid transport system substrate-binding protein